MTYINYFIATEFCLCTQNKCEKHLVRFYIHATRSSNIIKLNV